MDALRAKLSKELATVAWRDLRGHASGDRLIVVAPSLDLVEVACRVAADCSGEVGDWIAAGQLRKPGSEELTVWERQLDTPFRLLIVTPYLLVQAV